MTIAILTALILAFLYLVMTLPAHLGWFMRRRQGRNDDEDLPVVSVIIPAHNEGEALPACIRSLLAQNYPAELLEFIVVDDYSSDEIAAVVAEYPLVRLITNTGDRGKKHALRIGIEAAQSGLIICTDADCILQRGHIRTLAGFFRREGYKLLLGPVRMQPGSSFASRFAALDFLSLQAAGAGFALWGMPVMANGSNLAFSKEAYLMLSGSLRGETIASGDDMFLLQGMLRVFGRASVGYLFDSEVIVDTASPPDWRSLFRQRLRWAGKGRYYGPGFTLSLALVVALFNISIVMLWIAGIFKPMLLLPALLLTAYKILIDLPLLRSFAAGSDQMRLMRLYFVSALLYPFYVTILAIAAALVKPAGKGWEG